jgi:hypothetical protein
MKTIKRETAYTYKNIQAKTGFLSKNSIKNLLHFNSTATQPLSNVSFQGSKSAYREEETSRFEVEAELRKEQARTYTSITPFR